MARDRRADGGRRGRRRSLAPIAGALGFVACALVIASGVLTRAVAEGPCSLVTAEKLGVGFARVCPRQKGVAPFFVSAPLPCGQGEHAQVPCPHVTPLLDLGVASDAKLVSRAVMMVNAFTAHRICGMRFGGRLPTRAEREAARDALGIATLLATQGEETSGDLGLSELPEWVTRGACDNPSLPGKNCSFGTFPPALLPLPLAWDAVRACEATAGRPTKEACTLGHECPGHGLWPGPGLAADGARAATAWLAKPGSEDGSYALRCERPATHVHVPAAREPLAAVRCVVPRAALGSIDATPRTR